MTHVRPFGLQCSKTMSVHARLVKFNPSILHVQNCLTPYYYLSLRWFSLEEERVVQQSRDKYFPQLENQGINPVGDDAQVSEYLHKQSRTCNQRDKGVVSPFMVTCKSEI